jgi:hypothetical protein
VITLNGTGANGAKITTENSVTVNRPIALTVNSNNTITVNSTLTLNNGINGLTTDSVNGVGNIVLSGSGTLVENADNGTINPLHTFTDNVATTIPNGSIFETGLSQTYNGSLLLGHDVQFITLSGANSSVQINGSVDTANPVNSTPLSIDTGTFTLDSPIGATQPITSLDVTANTIALNNGTITTTSDQSYTGAVQLGTPTSALTSNSGSVTFSTPVTTAPNNPTPNLSIDAPAGNIQLSSIGTTNAPLGTVTLTPGSATNTAASLDGLVNVTSLAITGGGLTDINSGNITTFGAQNYSGPVNLGSSVTLTAAGIAFGSTLNGNSNSLILNDSSVSQLNGSLTNLFSLTTNAVRLTNSNVTTTNNQTYQGPVTLNTNATLKTTAAGNVDLSILNGINGAGNSLNLIGGANSNELFTLEGLLNVNSLDVTGGANGSNTLFVSSPNLQTWTVNGANGGSINGTGALGFSFSNIQNLLGSFNANNLFILNGGTLNGDIQGGTGVSNTIQGDNVPTLWTLVGFDQGTVTGVGTGFSNIQGLVGMGNANTLTGANGSNVWNITGTNAGSVTNVSSFQNMQNLTGGTSNNTFVFSDGAQISGTINGGSLAGTNLLNYFAYSSPVNVVLTGTNVGTSVNGGSTITQFTNITSLLAKNTVDNILTPPAGKTNVVVLTGFRKGFINDPIFFDGFIIPGQNFIPPAALGNINVLLNNNNNITTNLNVLSTLVYYPELTIPPPSNVTLEYTAQPYDWKYDEIIRNLTIDLNCASNGMDQGV